MRRRAGKRTVGSPKRPAIFTKVREVAPRLAWSLVILVVIACGYKPCFSSYRIHELERFINAPRFTFVTKVVDPTTTDKESQMQVKDLFYENYVEQAPEKEVRGIFPVNYDERRGDKMIVHKKPTMK